MHSFDTLQLHNVRANYFIICSFKCSASSCFFLSRAMLPEILLYIVHIMESNRFAPNANLSLASNIKFL